ncbi:cobalamin (vitamin B12) biosynthesis CbiG protein [Magnetococcus marinus MC-1]|uniref:Cobalamin (Vitamin B12) biosynthesis CbiG protein n=1 Tax=Magnetococcus marinus (strain ATCC BAA-1437 / JCM 17883 / MC-1) TaxID=156889 RepID=A0LCC7_MAGMM|nr:cobalamin biosynthesis central domain-containing protein [Magnetococcus marinus]ABK45620.1 cobalamin (vitamin B12) biosynthesis CbiG protein [Magnetococcus marinus MC-1]
MIETNSVKPKTAVIAITKHSVAHALKLVSMMENTTLLVSEKFESHVADYTGAKGVVRGPIKHHMAELLASFEQLVFFVSIGGVVRLIAPHLKSKESDPGVVCVDDAARFVIPILAGHVGGANDHARLVAQLLGAEPVITTASDVRKTIPVDILGRELGWKVEALKDNITRVSAHMVNEEAVAFVQEVGSRNWWPEDKPLPKNVQLFNRFEEVPVEAFAGILWVTNRPVSQSFLESLKGKLIIYRVPEES